jgi:hypothetical protein
MYTIFIVVTKKNEKEKKQHLDNVHNIHCCNPKKKKKNNIGQHTIRYKGGRLSMPVGDMHAWVRRQRA